MTDTCPTVAIKTAKGFALINESDFDPAKHERYIAPPPAPVEPPAKLPPPPPPGPLDGLPKNWRELDSKKLRELAAAATGRTPEDKKQAVDMIEQALASKDKK